MHALPRARDLGVTNLVTLRSSWVWPHSIERFVREHAQGRVLNVCSGRSRVGDVRVDRYESADVRADWTALPFTASTFDTVVSDPPWNVGLLKRPRPFFEAVRVCKPGGRVIYLSRWIPTSRETSLVGVWVVAYRAFGDGAVLSIHKVSKLL